MNNKNKSKNIAKSINNNKKNIFTLKNVNETLLKYIQTIINPNIVENGNIYNVPVKFQTPERSKAVRNDNYIRDTNTKQILLPIIVIGDNGFRPYEGFNIPHLDYNNTIVFGTKYGKNNPYGLFSLINEPNKKINYYEAIPAKFVQIDYTMNIWTAYKEHMDSLLTTFLFYSNKYWSIDNKNQYYVNIESYDSKINIVDDKRIVQADLKITVVAKILSDFYMNKPTIKRIIPRYKINIKENIG